MDGSGSFAASQAAAAAPPLVGGRVLGAEQAEQLGAIAGRHGVSAGTSGVLVKRSRLTRATARRLT